MCTQQSSPCPCKERAPSGALSLESSSAFTWEHSELLERPPTTPDRRGAGNVLKVDFFLRSVCKLFIWGNRPVGIPVFKMLLHEPNSQDLGSNSRFRRRQALFILFLVPWVPVSALEVPHPRNPQSQAHGAVPA